MFACMGRTFFLIFALLGAAVSGAVAEELTEAEALRRFSEDSPRARAARSRVPVVRAETPERFGFRPSLRRSMTASRWMSSGSSSKTIRFRILFSQKM